MAEYLVTVRNAKGDAETHRIDSMDEEGSILKNAKARGFTKHLGTVLNKSKSKSPKIVKRNFSKRIDEEVFKAQNGDVDAQDYVRKFHTGVVEKAKEEGVFSTPGEILVKGEAVTMGVSDWQPREVDDDLDVADDPASNPDDLADVEGDYSGGPSAPEIDAAVQAWLSDGDVTLARKLGIDESQLAALAHASTAIRITNVLDSQQDNARLQATADKLDMIQPKAGLLGRKS